MDLEAVRTFAAVADTGQFQEAAAELAVTQQAVSKRVAALEKGLGVRLFTRSARGAALTIDGQAFLPHARALLAAEERAVASVRPGRRALRVDVIERKLAPAGLLRAFHRAYPDIELGVVTLPNADAAVAAVRDGQIDAAIRAVPRPGTRLPEQVQSVRVDDEPLHILVGPGHPLAGERSVTTAQLVGHRIWMPTVAPGTEWGAYYLDLAAEFGLTLDPVGPGFGLEPLLATVADSTSLATFVGERTDLAWPADWGLRRVTLTSPTPIYPHSLVWHADNPHPALAALRKHLAAAYRPLEGGWAPAWSENP
ncbi:LysR family transcriptional regulator [Actinospica sp. MGRD01-02]|uniref:LysR family transcriptional regulator n=1 Tax=Actinospica acidithermotolerans TaxID=2828514 RepID=A0A941E7S7_9ACTN|nr:LysR family transcriptional regulator [Actinospica acidithermotolerans]MBR7826067.1 LysR family transcriptional regulator [Actinospica acidithermotolerans]